MKNSNRALSLILALVMTFSLSICATAAAWDNDAYKAAAKTVTTLAEDYTGKTVILHSNDVHGQVDGYAYMPALEKAFKEKGAEVIIVDAGDFSQGDLYVSANKGSAAIELMNAAGYDVVALGNHELDYGYAQLKENLSAAKFQTLCANVTEGGKAAFTPSYVYTTETGLKVGFVGIETPETATKVNPLKIKEIEILGGQKMYDCVQEQVDALKEDADIVVALAHLGVDAESALEGNRSIDLYGKVTGIDFMIDGHSHTVMTASENSEPVQSTGTKFENIGVVVINNATKKVEDHYLIPTADLAKDETVAAQAQKIIDEVDAVYGTVIGQSYVELNGEKSPNGNRDSQTNNGNLITDALLWYVKENKVELKVDADNVVAITNGGGIRAAVKPGDVTKGTINKVLPFGNTTVVIYVTGAELLEALEASTYSLPIGGYPQTAGIRWTLDTMKEFDKGENYVLYGKPTTYYAPKTIQRVSIQSVNGKAFDEKAVYAVITNDFIAAGGDTYAAFNAAYDQEGAYHGQDFLVPLDEVVMDYIEKELKGTITADKYGTPRTDLTVKLDPLAKYTDVDASLWYAAALRYVVENKMMTGTGDTAFSPNGTVTRGMVMTILARMEGEDTTPAAGQNWYDKGVMWAQLKNVSDGTRPTDSVTREEFATMLYRYIKELKGEGFRGAWMFLLENPDADKISSWADEPMHWMIMNGVVKGMDAAGNVVPQGNATRAQVAQMFLNYSNIGK